VIAVTAVPSGRMTIRPPVSPLSRAFALKSYFLGLSFIAPMMRLRAGATKKKERHTMPLYEHVFLARQDVSTQQVEGLQQTFRSLIEENGGSVGKTEYWGLKTLTYRIKKNRKAHYSLMNIDAPHEAVAEMERQMGLSTDIIRFLTIRVDEHEDAPSAMMRRSDRDERDGRRGPRRDHDRGPRDHDRPPRDHDRAPREEAPAPEAARTEDKSEAKSGEEASE